jgi:arginase family enzyme
VSANAARRILATTEVGLRLGAVVVEVAPPYDQTGNTALVGATMMFEIICLIADRHWGKK